MCVPQASTLAGDTALHLAARRRDVDMARILVDYGAVVDATNGAGQTSLHIAAAEGDEPLVKYFYGVRANAAIADNEGTALTRKIFLVKMQKKLHRITLKLL